VPASSLLDSHSGPRSSLTVILLSRSTKAIRGARSRSCAGPRQHSETPGSWRHKYANSRRTYDRNSHHIRLACTGRSCWSDPSTRTSSAFPPLERHSRTPNAQWGAQAPRTRIRLSDVLKVPLLADCAMLQ
jgi:hypothetical protein